MAQDAPQQPIQPGEPAEESPRNRSSVWPWIVLAVIVLVVVLLLWLYWRQPQQATVGVIEKTVEIPIVVPEPRPEPVVPGVVSGSAQTSTTPRVPDVLGTPRSSAVKALERAGYAVSTSRVYRASRASGFVVEQNPAGGLPLDAGGTVSIVIAIGSPVADDVKMPNIVGLSESAAKDKVTAAGLVPYLMYGAANKPDGTVISQWPAAGAMVPAGSEGYIQIQMSP